LLQVTIQIIQGQNGVGILATRQVSYCRVYIEQTIKRLKRTD
jgi:hypothetical protein